MDSLRHLPILAVTAVAALAAASCSGDIDAAVPSDAATAPATMTTRDVSTFISDSGYTRYHITTPLWQIFDEASDPYWSFPQGLELEQYDLMMRRAADIACDSATYFSRRRLWRLDGHVMMVNTLRDSFLTTQLYWDQSRRTVYSDSFIHIVRQDRIIEGYGFESNEDMTRFTVNRPTGIIPVDRPKPQSASAAAASPQEPHPGEEQRRRPAPRSASQRAFDEGNGAPAYRFTPSN